MPHLPGTNTGGLHALLSGSGKGVYTIRLSREKSSRFRTS